MPREPLSYRDDTKPPWVVLHGKLQETGRTVPATITVTFPKESIQLQIRRELGGRGPTRPLVFIASATESRKLLDLIETVLDPEDTETRRIARDRALRAAESLLAAQGELVAAIKVVQSLMVLSPEKPSPALAPDLMDEIARLSGMDEEVP